MEAAEVHLAHRPRGMPAATDFKIVRQRLAPLSEGQVLLQNLIISIDPYIRLQLNLAGAEGKVIAGSGLARVLESRDAQLRPGDLVRHRAGLRDVFIAERPGLTPFVARPDLSLTAQLHALGGIGLCAYGGLLGIGKLREGEQVFVSSAAGAVGSLAVQIARLKNCRVVGSTGSDEKAEWLREVAKVDVALNYRRGDIMDLVAEATPRGIDIYFDNVGGAHLQAALARMNTGGRIPVCGMISGYNGSPRPVVLDDTFIMRRLDLRGFGFNEFEDMKDSFEADMVRWLKDGSLVFQETVFEGLDQAPNALIALLQGQNIGKMLVHVSD